MNKKRYVAPESQIEVQVFTESSLLAGTITNEEKQSLMDGLPTFGAQVDNPSFIRRLDQSNSNTLWDDTEE